VWFLVLWLGLEVAGYFALTPFPAVRRVMGIIVVATLLTGRLASRTCPTPAGRALLRGVAGAGIALGLVFLGVDILDAYAEKHAAEEAVRLIRERGGGGTVWYVGHWGFQYYAERCGMVPVVPNQSYFSEGDWLVLPEPLIDQQEFVVDPDRTRTAFCVIIADAVPLRTVMGYYGGTTPLGPAEGKRLTVEVRRVTAGFRAVH
jgi:hypothetical protein